MKYLIIWYIYDFALVIETSHYIKLIKLLIKSLKYVDTFCNLILYNFILISNNLVKYIYIYYLFNNLLLNKY